MRSKLNHYERLTKDNSEVFNEMPELPKAQLMVTKQIKEHDTVVNQLEIKYENEVYDNSDLKVSDFKIENLEASGAIKGLKMISTKPNMREFESELIEFEKTIDENLKNEDKDKE